MAEGPHRGDEAHRLQFHQNVQQWQELLKASTTSQVLAAPADQWGPQGVTSLYDMLGGAAAMLAAGIPPAPGGLAPPSTSMPLLGRPLPTPRATNRRKTPSRPKAAQQPRSPQQAEQAQEEEYQRQAEPSGGRGESQSDQQGSGSDVDSAGHDSGRRAAGKAASKKGSGKAANGGTSAKAARGRQNGAESPGGEEEMEEEYAGLSEKELKAIRRKQANREAARRSRMRKQAEADMIAAKASELELYKQTKEQELANLRGHVEQLNGLVLQLAAHKVQLMEQVRSLGGTVPPEVDVAPAPAPVALPVPLTSALAAQQLQETGIPAAPASLGEGGNPAKRARTSSAAKDAATAETSDVQEDED